MKHIVVVLIAIIGIFIAVALAACGSSSTNTSAVASPCSSRELKGVPLPTKADLKVITEKECKAATTVVSFLTNTDPSRCSKLFVMELVSACEQAAYEYGNVVANGIAVKIEDISPHPDEGIITAYVVYPDQTSSLYDVAEEYGHFLIKYVG